MRIAADIKRGSGVAGLVLAAGGVLAGLVWLLVLQLEARDRQAAIAAGEIRIAEAAVVARNDVADKVQTMDHALQVLLAAWQRSPESFAARAAELKPLFGGAVIHISVIGADGVMVFSDLDPAARGLDRSTREHFTVHRDGKVKGLFISRPVLSEVSGKWSLHFTRPIRAAADVFGGVMVLSMDPASLTEVHPSLGLGKGGALAVVGADGVIRARVPAVIDGRVGLGVSVPSDRPFLARDAPPRGSFRARSIVDGEMQFYRWEQIEGQPLMVVVLLRESAVFEAVEQVTRAYRRAAWAGTAGIALAAASILALLRRKRRAERLALSYKLWIEQTERRLTGFSADKGPLDIKVHATYRRFAAMVIGIAVAFSAVCVASLAGFVWLDWRRTIEAAENTTREHSRVAESFLRRTLGDFDRDLQLLRRQIPGATPEAIQASLAARMPINPEIMDLLVLDRDGRIVYWTQDGAKPDVTDRSYFTAHRTGDRDVLHVSEPALSKVHRGRYFFALSRRLSGPGGEFDGVVVQILAIDALAEAMGGLVQRAHATITLATVDGVVLFRYPRGPGDSGTVLANYAAGRPNVETLHGISPFDGRPRIVTRMRVGSYPLVVGATLDKGAILAPLHVQIASGLGLGGAALGLVALVAAMVLRISQARFSAVEALQGNRHRLASVIEGTNVGTWEWEVATGRTWFNQRWAEIAGYTLDEIGPTSVETWRQFVHPDDLAGANEQLRRHFAGELPHYSHECRIRHKDGSWLWVLDRGKVVEWGADGTPVRMAGTRSDVTAAKRAEQEIAASHQRLRQLLGCVGEGVFGVDAAGRCTWINPAALDMLGRTEDEVLGADPHALFCPTTPDGGAYPRNASPIAQTLSDGRRRGVEDWFIRGDGQGFPIHVTVAAMTGEDGGIEGAVVSFHDISARKNAEAQLLQSNAELEQFAYVVSHDLRQPLRMVSSFVQLLERHLGTGLDDKAKEFMDFVRGGALRMDQMLVSLLEYSRLGRSGEPMEQIDCGTLVDEALGFLRHTIEEAGAAVTLPDAWPRVRVSRNEGVRLFQNLVGNAIKYRAKERAPAIGIAVERQGREWLFSIRDNGIGIAAGQAEHLFKVFKRLHSSEAYEGTGIGLAVCRRIVERHGGRIWVESEGEDRGSTFRFTLPAIEP